MHVVGVRRYVEQDRAAISGIVAGVDGRQQHCAANQAQAGQPARHPGNAHIAAGATQNDGESNRSRTRQQTIHKITPTPNMSAEKKDITAAASLTFRWPVRGRVIAGFGPDAKRAGKPRHQLCGAGRHADQSGGGGRGRLCRQRTQDLRQSRADPARQRLRHRLRPCQRNPGQARRSDQARPSHRQIGPDRQRVDAAIAL